MAGEESAAGEDPLLPENLSDLRELDQTGLLDLWNHFTCRGHDGPVLCVDATHQADLIYTGSADYTTRVWKYDERYDAYDLVAEITHEPPADFVEPTPSCMDWLGSMICGPKKVDWESMPLQGVTGIGCAYSQPKDGASYRNGPVISGTAHGDLYVVCLSGTASSSGTVKPMLGLHAGAVNDICVAPTYPEGDGSGCSFLAMTASADGTSALLAMQCVEAPNPNFTNYKPVERNAFVDVLCCGGGGRLRVSPDVRGVDDGGEAATCLQFKSITKVATCQHESQVFCARHLGDNRQDGRATFATCTTEGAHLWSCGGEKVMFLKIAADEGTKFYVSKIGVRIFPVAAAEHHALGVVNRDNGSMLFIGGDGYVGVWGLDEGKVGVRDEKTNLIFDDETWEEKRREGASLEPLCVYQRPGGCLDIDQSGTSTTFCVQVQRDGKTVDLWGLEAVEPGSLVMEPQGAASLLVCPGKEKILLQMAHAEKVCDVRVVEDEEGPALITGSQDGTVHVWDLEGDDGGQCYAEMRSLKPLEILLPPILLGVTAVQMFSFAFGPAIPWQKEVHQEAAVVHDVAMLDFKYKIKINRETIFWPEMTAICIAIIFFQVSAAIGLPEMSDQLVQAVHGHVWLRTNARSVRDFLLRIVKNLRWALHLAMQLLSTVLVVPMIQSCAQAVDCVHPEGYGWLKILFGKHAEPSHLASAPTVMCYRGLHLRLVFVLLVIMPFYLLFLVPFAVAGGDAKFVPRKALYSFRIWEDKNPWRLASVRKSTDLHMAFLHANPKEAFRTLFIELAQKISIPVITTWTTSMPLFQMAMVTLISFLVWLNSLLHPPYVERKFCVFVQDLKLLTVCAMACGVLTVYLDDPTTWVPIFLLVGSCGVVVVSLLVKLCMMDSARPFVKRLVAPRGASAKCDEESAAE